MKLEYETERLTLKILKPAPEYARDILRFYDANRCVFEPYEPLRPNNFYTENYQKTVLTYEYNLAVRMTDVRFWVYEKINPDRIIGTVCFHNIVRSVYDRCEAGYKFDQNFWHLGYAREAMTLGLSVMFDDLRLHRIEAYVMENNKPSIRLLNALGFQYEGICRQAIRIRDNWEDHMLYALIR